MKINSEIKGKQLYKYTNCLTKLISNNIWETQRYVTPFDRTCYTILHKIRSLLDTSSFLLTNTNLDGKPHYFDSLYLILRTCLSDAICLFYIIEKHDDPEAANSRVVRILVDHFRHILGDISPDEKVLLESQYPNWIENGKIKNGIEKISATIMAKEIEDEVLKPQVLRALKVYKYFSKLEHNGILSFHILHDRYDETFIEDDKFRVIDAIFTVMIAVNSTILNWVEKSDSEMEELMKLTEAFISD